MRILYEADRERLLFAYLLYYPLQFRAFARKKGEQNNPRSQFRLFIARKPSSTNTRQLLTSCRVALVREFTTRVDSARWSRLVSNCIASRTYFPASGTVMDGREEASAILAQLAASFSQRVHLRRVYSEKKKLNAVSPVIPRDIINTLQS